MIDEREDTAVSGGLGIFKFDKHGMRLKLILIHMHWKIKKLFKAMVFKPKSI